MYILPEVAEREASYTDTGITDVRAGRERYHNSGGTSGYRWYYQECGQSLCETRVLCEEGVSAYMLTVLTDIPARLSQVKQTGTSYS